MSYDFFRKERPSIFKERAEKKTAYNWVLKSETIFRAKMLCGTKKEPLTTTIDGKQVKVTLTTGNKLHVKSELFQEGFAILSEEDLRIYSNMKDTPQGKVINFLFEKHTTSSTNSPLISGCIINNFHNSKFYPGYKLHLQLRTRQPIRNSFFSGNEGEHFLIGEVTSDDCGNILLLGKTKIGAQGDVTFTTPVTVLTVLDTLV